MLTDEGIRYVLRRHAVGTREMRDTRRTPDGPRSRPKSPSRTTTSPTILGPTPKVRCRSLWLERRELRVARWDGRLTVVERAV